MPTALNSAGRALKITFSFDYVFDNIYRSDLTTIQIPLLNRATQIHLFVAQSQQ